MKITTTIEDDFKHRTSHGWITIIEAGAETPNALLDGSVHNDTVAEAVLRGKLIIGNSTPAWAGLAIGGNGDLLGSDATDPAWRKFRLAVDGANVNLTASTVETTMKSLTITGGTIGANGVLFVYLVWKVTGTNGTKTLRIKLGATTLATRSAGASTVNALLEYMRLNNRNAQNSQYMIHDVAQDGTFPEDGTATGYGRAIIANTFAVDTSANQTLAVTGQLANGADQIDVRQFYVWVIK